MTTEAERLLAAAKGNIERGEQFYRQAADEIVAAMAAEPTLSYRQIGEQIGRSYEWVRRLVTWSTNVTSTGTPFAEETGAVAQRHARSVLRSAEPQQIAEEIINDPQIRANVSRALDQHYERETRQRTERTHAKEVERRGGEEEHAAFKRRQRIAEVVNVARGLVTGMRFVVAETKRLELDAFEEAGVIEELTQCGHDVEGFASLLRQFLSGETITDDAIADWIGGRS